MVIKSPDPAKLTPARRTASLPAARNVRKIMSSAQAAKEATPVIATWEVSQQLPKVAYGQGCYVIDQDGKRYIDGSGGPAVFSLGHAHPEVNAAIKDQLDRIAHGYRYTFSSDPLEELTAMIAESCGGGLKHMT